MAARISSLDDVHWKPPTEAELKIIEARRERSDKISKLMGDYLLKGYKMLSITCKDCETILLQDRHNKLYCVACKELDSDTDKDNPLINHTAAMTQVREQQRVTSHQPDDRDAVTSQITDTRDRPLSTQQPKTSSKPFIPSQPPPITQSCPVIQPPPSSTSVSQSTSVPPPVVTSSNTVTCQNPALDPQVFTASICVLQNKLKWATGELEQSLSVEYSVQLCQLIKSCADAIHSCQHT